MIEIPKLLILAQKRSGSHFLQGCIRNAGLTGVTFLDYIRDGGSIDPVDPNLYRKKNIDNLSVQFFRYHDFNTRDDAFIQWLSLSEYVISRAPRVIILKRSFRFDHTVSDWFNDKVFDRNFKRAVSHEAWTAYRDQLIKETEVPLDEFEFYIRKSEVFYRLFSSLHGTAIHSNKFHTVYYEHLSNPHQVVNEISSHAGFDVGVDGQFPVWEAADYSEAPNYSELEQVWDDFYKRN